MTLVGIRRRWQGHAGVVSRFGTHLDGLSIRAKLALGFGVVLGAMLLATLASTGLLWRISAANQRSAEASLALGRIIEASEQALVIRSSVLEARLNDDPSKLAALPEQSIALSQAVDALSNDHSAELSDRVKAFLVTASEAQPLLESRQQLVSGLLEPSIDNAMSALEALMAQRPSAATGAALSQLSRARTHHGRFLRSGDLAELDAADAAVANAVERIEDTSDARVAIDDYLTALLLIRANQGDFERVVVNNLQSEGGQVLDALRALQAETQKDGEAASASAASLARWAMLSNTLLAILGLAVGVLLAVVIRRRIVGSVTALSDALTSIARDLDFTRRIHVQSNDELGQATTELNHLLATLDGAIGDVAQRTAAVAAGDFSHGRDSFSAGDIGRLESSIESTRTALSLSFQKIREVNQALSEGRFDLRIDIDGLQGDFLVAVRAANLTAETFRRATGQIGQSVALLAQGRFDQRVETGLPGQLGDIADSINQSLSGLQAALTAVVETARALSEGDLTRPVHGQFEGGLADLQSALNGSITGIGRVIRAVEDSARQLNTAAQALNDGANDLSQQAQLQATFIERTAALVEELGASVDGSAKDAVDGSRDAARTEQLARQSLVSAASASSRIRELERGSQQIGEITGTIRAIAFQTNILALNAAVEAARAGEWGRGFAVVATEVRALAQRADDATLQISEQVEETRKGVGRSLEEFTGMETSITNLAERSRHVAAAFGQAASSASEQARAISQISHATLELDGMGQRMRGIVGDTTEAAAMLASVAEDLVQQVGRFRIDVAGDTAAS